MKKIVLYITLFSFQINHNSCVHRIDRYCHLHYSQDNYRKELGNTYFKEVTNRTNATRTLHAPVKSPCRKSTNNLDLSSLLTIQSLLPSVYHKPQISPYEILPKR
ncbi:hypothetical protein HYV10_02860 [Candidatus Dependentiae bacterium]|nr:hypothetical protein [Candidatus Dependentiae bacterium]